MKNRSRLVSAILSTDSYFNLDLQEKRMYSERLAKMTDDELVLEVADTLDRMSDGNTPFDDSEDSPSQSEEKDGWYWYGQLTPKQTKQWDKNFEENRVSEMSKADYLNAKYYSFSQFLKASFVWMFTNQGHMYWENICDNMKKGVL